MPAGLFPAASTPAIMSDISADQVTHDTPPRRNGASTFGSFYPTNYVLAVFAHDPDADIASLALQAAGFSSDDIIIASGPDVAEHDDAVRSAQSPFAKLGDKWSRLYTDEAVDDDLLADDDSLMDMARNGAAFALVYAGDQADTDRAMKTLKPFGPVVLRKYDMLAITEL